MHASEITPVGLRIDVDTFRGTRDGVVRLVDILSVHDIQASFFFTVGPDNMGRHLWRLWRPAFLKKMLCSKVASLYGWDILLRGTLWPGPMIGERLGHIIQATVHAGHEVGFHAWDHHAWQANLDTMDDVAIRQVLRKGIVALTRILGRAPTCSAAAAWKCNEKVLLEKNRLAFDYNSDCRGQSIFRPQINGIVCAPQVPVTLPTYDEVIGRNGITDKNYNDSLLSSIHPNRMNVLTIHAEVEGLGRAELFRRFLETAKLRSITFVPLRALLPPVQTIPTGTIEARPIPGREGWGCWQKIS